MTTIIKIDNRQQCDGFFLVQVQWTCHTRLRKYIIIYCIHIVGFISKIILRNMGLIIVNRKLSDFGLQ